MSLRAHAIILAVGLAGAISAPVLAGDGSRPVLVRGWGQDLMEPFLTRDGKYLFFNNSNEKPRETDLFVAERIDDVTFQFLGPLEAANSQDLDGVASADAKGNFFFVSPRAYAKTAATIHRGRLIGTKLHDVRLLEELKRGPGWVHFDAEVSADGERLYLAEGKRRLFGDGWSEVDLVLARASGDGLAVDRSAASLIVRLNGEGWDYAPCLSRDELRIWYTRYFGGKTPPAIWGAERAFPDEPFGPPFPVPLDGFVEAPTLSIDERLLYFHRKTPGGFKLFVIETPRY